MINTLFANSYSAVPMFHQGFHIGFGNMGASMFFLSLIMFIILMIFVVLLKGYALWNAAKRGEVVWFIILLLVNTIGILDLVYLIFIVKKWRNLKTPPTPDQTTNQTPKN